MIEEVKKALKLTENLEKEIENLKFYVDIHLNELSKAIKEGNEENIEFQKQKLQELWNKLFELEAFPLKEI